MLTAGMRSIQCLASARSGALCPATSEQISQLPLPLKATKKESWNVSWILFSIANKFLYRRSWAVIYLGCLLPDISCGSPIVGRGKRPTLLPSTLLPTGVYRASTSRYCWCALTDTFAPLPFSFIIYHLSFTSYSCSMFNVQCSMRRRYFSVALSSRSLALGVTQQVWSFGSPDFPQTCLKDRSATTSPTLFSI